MMPRSQVTRMPLEKIPNAMRAHYEAVVALTDEVCLSRLNEEYAELARRLAAALARKRPCPLLQGQLKSWACGIVYALGHVNFLFSKSSEPHLEATELCRLFGVAKGTGYAKSAEIRKWFRMDPMDADWCLPSELGDNLSVWLVSIDGFVVDIRQMPREWQELAYKKGIIPWIPADRVAEEQ